jgi:hypothetical protein
MNRCSKIRRVLSTLLAALTLGGCVSFEPGERPLQPFTKTELAYQLVSAADFATTINIARRPDCYSEGGMPTAMIIGNKPSVASVAGWWALQATLHVGISSWLEREADATDSQYYRGAAKIWQSVTIGYSAYNLVHNYQIGLRPFGNGPARSCAEYR